ncbi:unnamed protein product [Zymoseptoria tritici ST99CH_3D1]|nr:unnamed protein product [Zymoseptoria tritici ST99CH_3D1]
MAELVNDFLAVMRGAGSRYVLKTTIISEGEMKGKVLIEVVADTGFRFLDLPTELRDRIYRLILVHADPVSLTGHTVDGKLQARSGRNLPPSMRPSHTLRVWDVRRRTWSSGEASSFSILSVNKQIHNEATPVMYGAHTFRQNSSTALALFVGGIGSSAKYLTAVDFGGGTNTSWSNLRNGLIALKNAPNLRKMIFEDKMLLNALRQHTSHHDVPRPAVAMSDCLFVVLPKLQKALEASGRAWKAVDVPCLRSDVKFNGKTGSKEAQQLMEKVRKLNEEYL